MEYSTKISERMWNQPDKGELEAEREQTFIDDAGVFLFFWQSMEFT